MRSTTMGFTRRDFLGTLAAASALPLAMRTGAATTPVLERSFGRASEKIPAVGLGTSQSFDVGRSGAETDDARAALARFVELGGRVVDSSPMYGRAEDAVGTLAAELKVDSKLFIATKIWTRGSDEGARQLADSQRLLRREQLDLVQVHNLQDTDTHLATLRAAREAGKVRYIGLTHYTASAHAELERRLPRDQVDAIQINYSLAEPEADRSLLNAAAAHGVAVLINRPFADGAIFARTRGASLPPWAAEIGCTSVAQILLKWVLGHPAVTCALVGSRNAAHVADNLAAASEPLPDDKQRAQIAAWFASL